MYLEKLGAATVSAGGDGEALHDLHRVGAGHHVLVAEAAHHHRDQEAEEGLQLPQAILVQAEEGEGVRHGDEDSAPQGN